MRINIHKFKLVFGLILSASTLLFADPPTNPSTWTWINSTISSVSLINGNALMFTAIGYNSSVSNCSPCASQTFFYIVDPVADFPSNNVSEMARYQALLMASMSAGNTVNFNYKWDGFTKGPGTFPINPYVVNWISLNK
jgi:hypothetical protein